MAEAIEETAPPQPAPEAPAPEVPEPTEPAATEPASPDQPASPPDLGDALGQMRDMLEERLPAKEPEPEPDLYSQLAGEPEGELPEYHQPEPQQPQQPRQPLNEEQQFEQQLNNVIEARVQQALEPHLVAQQAQDDRRQILAFAEAHPRMRDPEVSAAVTRVLDAKAQRYDNAAMRTDPQEVEEAYFAYEARQAAQTSQTPEGAGGTPAEANGSQGTTTLETGAGPGTPPPAVDPLEQLYTDALSDRKPGGRPDIIG